MELTFTAYNVTNQLKMLQLAAGGLPPEIINDMADILVSPPSDNLFDIFIEEL